MIKGPASTRQSSILSTLVTVRRGSPICASLMPAWARRTGEIWLRGQRLGISGVQSNRPAIIREGERQIALVEMEPATIIKSERMIGVQFERAIVIPHRQADFPPSLDRLLRVQNRRSHSAGVMTHRMRL